MRDIVQPPAAPARPKQQLRRWIFLLALCWIGLIIFSFCGVFLHHQREIDHIAIAQVRAYFNRDLALRAWAASHGGVYVPVDPETPPNPYLDHLPNRDIEGPNGLQLTLMNPAYIVRQINERFPRSAGVQWHLTSLRPLRPENGPDPWERQALITLEQGQEEVVEFMDLNGEPYLRYIRALRADPPCLSCHGQQGYRAGDVRGGLSISLAMAELRKFLVQNTRTAMIMHGFLLLMGIGTLFAGHWLVSRRIEERERAREALRASEQKFRTVADFTYAWEYWRRPDGTLTYVSPSCERISGYTPEEFMTNPELVSEIIVPEDRDLYRRHMEEVHGGKNVVLCDYRILPKEGGGARWVSHICQPVFGAQGQFLGRRVSIHDITARKKAEEEKERLIAELRDALGKVKQLRGLLPICASCKKIRDDRGYWNQIESYIGAHSEAEFSHSICPECADKLYPELYLYGEERKEPSGSDPD